MRRRHRWRHSRRNGQRRIGYGQRAIKQRRFRQCRIRDERQLQRKLLYGKRRIGDRNAKGEHRGEFTRDERPGNVEFRPGSGENKAEVERQTRLDVWTIDALNVLRRRRSTSRRL